MTSENNIVLEHLRKIRADLSQIKADVHDLKRRTSSLERHAGEILIEIGALNGRMDRFDERLARIERPSQRARRSLRSSDDAPIPPRSELACSAMSSDEGYYGKKQLRAIVLLSATQIARLEAQGKFPQRVRLGPARTTTAGEVPRESGESNGQAPERVRRS